MKQSGNLIELRLGVTLLRRSHLAWGLGIVLGVPLLFLVIVFLVVAGEEIASKGLAEVLASAWESAGGDEEVGAHLWALLILSAAGLLLLKLQNATRLKLTHAGMEVFVPRVLGTGPMGPSAGHWSVHWDSVRSIHLVPGRKAPGPAMQLGLYRLVIDAGREQKRIAPFAWYLPGGPDHRLSLREAISRGAIDPAEVIERAPLIQALRKRGFELSTEPPDSKNAPSGFDLAKHPGMVVQLSLFFAAAAYAIVDYFILGSFMALEPVPSGPFVVTTVAAALIAYFAGKGAPTRERWVVGGLLVIALTAAVYPGLLRYNAMTAERQPVRYNALAPGQFESTVPGFPNLDLRKLKVPEYWAEYPPGAQHEFDVMRGAGGFYQIDLKPLYDRTREFYAQRNEED